MLHNVHLALSVGQPLQPTQDPRRAPDMAQESSEADTPMCTRRLQIQARFALLVWMCVNDPYVGSPTETLLRLLLPLNDKA